MSAPTEPRGRPAPYAAAVLLFRRAVGRDANPLCRPIDRARSRLRLAVAAALAAAVAVSALVALALLADMRFQAAVTAAHRHAVTAVTAAPAATGPGQGPARAPAVWQYPPGHPVHGTVPVPTGPPAGTAVPVWVDDTGAPASAPRGRGAMEVAAGVYGAVALTGLTATVGCGYMLRRRSIERRAERGWESEWETVEPAWSRRGRP